VNEHRVKELLGAAGVPQARDAQERGWRVVLAAYELRHPVPTRPRLNRLVVVLAAALLILAIALSPAGAKVADLVHDVVQPGEENARPALTSLPTSGQILVTSAKGPWVVDPDGSKRLLGAYEDAAWSPHGLFVAGARGRQLTAVEPTGNVHWSVGTPHPASDPAWSPSGIRIAYLSGNSLRVVAGDGTGDRLIARRVAPVAPAWRPLRGAARRAPSVVTGPATNVLAYVDRRGRVLIRDTDTDRLLIRTPPGPTPTDVSWSSDGRRLLTVSPHLVSTFYAHPFHRFPTTFRPPARRLIQAASFRPGTHRVAAVETSGSSRATAHSAVLLGRTDVKDFLSRKLFAGPGRFRDLAWSPDGQWLLVGWRDADQWLFLHPADGKVRAVSNISRQFDPGARGRPPFPGVSGWCCAR
jgi:WD40 repeat protein